MHKCPFAQKLGTPKSLRFENCASQPPNPIVSGKGNREEARISSTCVFVMMNL
jgi:hypothetical protein